MCDPVSLTMLAVAVVGGGMAKNANDKAIVAQAQANSNNTREAYRAAQEGDRSNKAAAFEATTDRMRQTQRQLSMARVIAAEGGGSLAANAINIAAGSDEDTSRIEAGVRNQSSSVRDTMAAAQTSNADALTSAQVSLGNNQTKFLTDIASAGAGAYVGSAQRQSQIKIANNFVSDAERRKLIHPWASGTKGMGD